MRHHPKAIALIFVFLLAGHDCARIQEHQIAGAARLRFKRNYKSGLGSQWMTFAREVCPMSYNIVAVQERYHKKVTKLYQTVQTMEDSEWMTTFMWKLREVGLRLDGLGSCVVAASSKPELVDTLTDSKDGLMPVLAKVMDRVMAQLRQRDVLNLLETTTCKVHLEKLSKQELLKWKANAEADVVKATHTLLFGAECDVDSYISSLGLSAASRKDLRDLDSGIIMMANNSLQQNGFQTSGSALKKAREVLGSIPSESPHDDDGGTFPFKQLVHDSQNHTRHEKFHGDEQSLRMQHTIEKSALIEGDARQITPDFIGLLDALAYLGTWLAIFVLIIALLVVIAYGVGPVVKGFGSLFTSGGNDTQESDQDYQKRHQAAAIEQLRRKFTQLESDTQHAAAKGSHRSNSARQSSKRNSSRRNSGRRSSSRRVSFRGRKGSMRGRR